MSRKIRRVCVYCGSSSGNNGNFIEKGTELGTKLALENIGIVYGGASVGIMNAVANAALSKNGEVIGVIPKVLMRKELAHPSLTKQYIVETMHERKALMTELSDAFLVLPGGFGTLDELFETITWAQLGIHDKPIGLLNINDYFDPLIDFIRHAANNGFIRHSYMDLFYSVDNIDDSLRLMKDFKGVEAVTRRVTEENI